MDEPTVARAASQKSTSSSAHSDGAPGNAAGTLKQPRRTSAAAEAVPPRVSIGAGVEDGTALFTPIRFEELGLNGAKRRALIEPVKDTEEIRAKDDVVVDDEDDDDVGNDSQQDLANGRQRSLLDFRDFEKQYRKVDSPDWSTLDRKARQFYLTQNEEIEAFRDLERLNDPADPDHQQSVIDENNRIEKLTTTVSGVGNIILLVSLVVAFAFSGAISIIASLLDAGLDNLSVLVIFLTAWAKRRVDRYRYPQGKERLEPVGVMVFSSIMGTSSIILIVESVRKLATDPYSPPDTSFVSVGLLLGDLVMKSCLLVFCWRYRTRSATAAALAQDHRNDLFLNSVALITSFIGAKYWAPLDPLGAILIALWTGFNWSMTCIEHMQYLTGVSASPDFLKRLTFICYNHHVKILGIDTVRAFHFGMRYLVEIDVVLPPDMSLKEAHDIGESLQLKVERLEEVERAFVHLDFETAHNPLSEHKQWGTRR